MVHLSLTQQTLLSGTKPMTRFIFRVLLVVVFGLPACSHGAVTKMSSFLTEPFIEPVELYQLPEHLTIPKTISDLESFVNKQGQPQSRLARSGGRFVHLIELYNDSKNITWVADVNGNKLRDVKFHVISDKSYQIMQSGYYANGEFPMHSGRIFNLEHGQRAILAIEYNDSYFPKDPRILQIRPLTEYASLSGYHSMITSALFGVLLILLGYVAVEAYYKKDTIAFYYCGYLGFLVLGFAVHFSVLQQVTPFDYYRFHFFAFLLAIFFNIRFSIGFLQLKQQKNAMFYALNTTAIICLIFAPISLFEYAVSSVVARGAILVWSSLSLIAGVLRLAEGYRPALNFTLAFAWLASALFLVLVIREIFPIGPSGHSFDSDLLVFIAACIEAILLALAITHRQKLFSDNDQKFRKQLESQVKKRTEALSAAKSKQEVLIEQLKYANKAKTRFLANMSHEIRTPLTAIIGYSDTLANGHVPAEQHDKALNVIADSSKHLLDVINDILDVSQIESGKVSLDIDNVRLFEVIEQAIQGAEFKAINKGITLRVEPVFPLPSMIITDGTKLKQILINLLNNAVKFTEQGHVVLAIRDNNDRLCFDIKDTGIGIAENEIEHIFSAFMQADPSIKRKYHGSGLGLTICKQFSHQLDGDLTVSSQLNEGSTFSFHIPMKAVSNAPWIDSKDSIHRVNNKPTRPFEPLKGNQKLTALLVEDHPQNREYIKLILMQSGIEVDLAEDGEVATKMAASYQYDVILLDIQMPVMDGLSAFQTIRKFDNKTPIVAMTANNLQHEIEQYRALGFNSHLAKPIIIADLSRLLSEIEQRRL